MTTISTTVPRPASGDAPLPPPPAPPRAWGVWRAMLWKECREMGLVAGLSALQAGGTLGVLAVAESRAVTSGGSSGYVTAGDFVVYGSMEFVAVIAAAAMGFVQFIGESRPDRFGLMAHRPVSRSMVFWCKAAVGIGLYGLAMLLPLVIVMGWASDPYNIPLPFSWSMIGPPLTDMVAALPFYFAGAIVARRSEARWVGARVLPLAAPILSVISNTAMPEAGWGLVISVVATGIMATAARGVYVSGAQYVAVHANIRACDLRQRLQVGTT